jgi:16S rRNA (uracil1498-N3)-methyltransferase
MDYPVRAEGLSPRREDDTPKHRFFLSPELLSGDWPAQPGSALVRLPPDLSRQLFTVLRLRPGARVLLLDGSGWEYLAELAGGGAKEALARILERRPSAGEPRLHLTLYAALLKGQHLEWVLQKGTELGVSAFVPIVTVRTIVRGATGVAFKKRARWERILREAAEQCRRARIPQLSDPLPFADACREAASSHERVFMPYVQESGRGLAEAACGAPPERAALLIGPEGGFDETEARLALERGIEPVSLGPRTLRAETAALAAATILMDRWGEMGVRETR